MVHPTDPEELELVTKAIQLGLNLRGCCEWEDRASRRIRISPPGESFTPEWIKEFLCEYVCGHPDKVVQVKETRAEYGDRPFYYKVVVPCEEFQIGLFVELILTDDDPEYPVVSIVNAHERKG